jgi:hypothetical protein
MKNAVFYWKVKGRADRSAVRYQLLRTYGAARLAGKRKSFWLHKANSVKEYYFSDRFQRTARPIDGLSNASVLSATNVATGASTRQRKTSHSNEKRETQKCSEPANPVDVRCNAVAAIFLGRAQQLPYRPILSA